MAEALLYKSLWSDLSEISREMSVVLSQLGYGVCIDTLLSHTYDISWKGVCLLYHAHN